MKISWNGTALVIDMQGDILISPTGGLTPGRTPSNAIQVTPPMPFELKIEAGTVVETSPANVAQIEERILGLLRMPPLSQPPASRPS